VAALPLLQFLLEHATPAERAAVESAIAEGVWSGPEFVGSGEGQGYRRVQLRAAAERVFATILARVLAQPVRPRATARDEHGRRVDLDLEELRDSVQFVNWATGTLEAPPRGYRPALYRAAITVEVEAESGNAAEPTRDEREAAIRQLAADHPKAGQGALYRLHRRLSPTVKIPRRLFPKKPGGRPSRD
jgi:hypothetical protein